MERRGYIGASDVPTILGVNLFKSKVQLWEEKTGLIVDNFTGNLSTDLGHYTEPKAAELALEHLKKELNNSNLELIDPQDEQISCPEFLPLKSRPDRYIICRSFTPDDDITYNLELKTAFSAGSRKKWEAGVPDAYYWQVQTQMLCTGLKTSYIAAITEGPDFFCYKIKADYQAHERILAECRLFWECVQSKQMPIIDKIEAEDKEYLTEDADADASIDRYMELKTEVEIRNDEMNQIKADLGTFIKSSAGYKHKGKSAVWVHKKPTLAFNSASAERYIKDNYQGDVNEFYKERQGASYIRIASKADKA